LVQIDQIYATKENRRWLKEKDIRITASPMGRPKAKEKETPYFRRKKRKEKAERNQIEGKFGQGKNGYSLNQMRARLKETSESWVACIFFVMNLLKYAGDFSFAYFLALYKWLRQALSAQSVSSGHINASSMNFQPDNNRIKLCPLKIAC
jgi:transposase, IS5 family